MRRGICLCDAAISTFAVTPRGWGMERLRLVQHGGKQVVLLDFANATDPARTMEEVDAVKAWFASQPPTRSLRTVTDATGAAYTTSLLQAVKELAAHNRPYIGASAVVVRTAFERMLLRSIALLAGRKMAAFATREAALDWVAAQRLDREGAEAGGSNHPLQDGW
jgi:hypothetical protein